MPRRPSVLVALLVLRGGAQRRARGRRAERAPAVDDVAAGVLIGQPRRRPVLVDARLAVVADAVGERLLQRRPLLVGERDRVVLAAHRLELALQDVVGLGLVGGEARRAVRLDRLVADLERDVLAVAVGAAVGQIGGLVLADLLRQRQVAVVVHEP